MSQTVVTVDVGGTGANNANAALTNLGALPTFGGSISGNLNVASSLVVTGNANLGNYVVSGNSISTTQTNGDVVLTPKGTGRLRVRSKILSGNGAEAHFSSSGIDESSIGIGSFNDSNGAAELLIVNKNSGTLAYSEMIAINDTGDQDQGWISVGVNSSGYDDPEYTLTGPDDGYVLFEAPQGTSANGDLIIGTGSYGLNNKIVMAAGGFTPTDAQLVIMPADLKRANLTSYIVASNVVTFTTDTTHTFIANDIVAISSVGAPYDGTRTITAVTSNTFNVSVTVGNIGPINLSPAGFALQFLPFNKGTVELTAQLFVGENSRSTIETADITLAEGHAIPLGIVVDNDGPGQTVMFNKSNGTLSYSEFIAHNDAGNVEMGWISMGINSSGYDDPEFPITKADDAYLLYEPPANTSGDGDLIIGTGTNGQKNRLIFAAEGFDEANAQMIITPNESVRISIPTDASSANTGALQVVGGVGVQGSMYVQGNQTIQGDLIVNGSQVIQSIENLAAAGPISLLSDGNIANTWDQGIVGTYAVSKTSNTHSVTFKAIANNTGTLTTANNHGFVAEDYVTVANVDVTFNGTHRITAATSNTISFFLLANNLSITAATGDATVDKAARYTGLVKRATDGNWRFFSGLGTRPAFNTDFTDANLAFDSIIAGSADFRGTVKLGSPNTATISYTDDNARTLTIPALAGNRTFAFINEAQTFTAAQAVSSTVTATKFIPTAGDATGNGLYLSGANKLGLTADGVERVSIGASETVVNDGSADYDFRVESDGNANMLFVDGGLNRVGVGSGAPRHTLDVSGNTIIGNTFYVDTSTNSVGIGTTDPSSFNGWLTVAGGINILRSGADSLWLHGDNNNTYIEDLRNVPVHILINSAERFTFSNTWNLGLNTTSPGASIHIRHPDPRIRLEDQNGGDNIDLFAEYGAGGTEFKIRNSTLSRTDLTIDGSGNVGIGTTSPQGKQHNYISSRSTGFSAGDGTTWHDLIIQNPNNTQGAAVGIAFELNSAYHSNAGTGIAAVKSTASSDYGADMVFVTRPQSAGAAEQMRITSAGLVGIGATSPNMKLEIAELNLGSAINSVKEFIRLRTSTTNNDYLDFFKIRDSDGGTDWTSAGWRIQQKIDNTWMGWMQFNGVGNLGGLALGTGLSAVSPRSVSERMRIDNSGNIGIGTTSPGNLLHVEGTYAGTIAKIKNNRGSASTDAGLEIETSTTAAKSLLVKNSGTNRFWIQGDGTAHFSGSVGIGSTSPVEKLHAEGTNISGAIYDGAMAVGGNKTRLKLGRDNNYNAGLSGYVASGQPGVDRVSLGFHVTTFTSSLQTFYEAMTLTDAGTLGIGTTSPTAQGLTIYQGGGDRRVLLELNRPNTPGLQTAIEFTVGSSIMVGRIQHEYEASNLNHLSFSLRSPGGGNFETLRLRNNGVSRFRHYRYELFNDGSDFVEIRGGKRTGTGIYTLFTRNDSNAQSSGKVYMQAIYATPSSAGYWEYVISGDKRISLIVSNTSIYSGSTPTIYWDGDALKVDNSNSNVYYSIVVELHNIGNGWGASWGNYPGIA